VVGEENHCTVVTKKPRTVAANAKTVGDYDHGIHRDTVVVSAIDFGTIGNDEVEAEVVDHDHHEDSTDHRNNGRNHNRTDSHDRSTGLHHVTAAAVAGVVHDDRSPNHHDVDGQS
jgi:hypothetical protein